MGSLYADDVCKKAEEWVGYHEGSNNWTIFAKILDDCGYFYPQTKQNVPWCATFCDCMCLISATPKDRDDEEKKWDAYYFLYQSSPNWSCGAEEFADYFKNADAFYTDEPQIGDMCFFYVNGEIGHVGIVVDTEDYITTIEGNAGDEVQKKWYSYDDIGDVIAGFGRPRYDGLYNPENISHEPTDEDKQEPPVKEDKKATEYRVCVGSFLNIRNGHSTDYEKIGELYDGAIVLVYEKIDGWARIGVNMWVAMDYLDEI